MIVGDPAPPPGPDALAAAKAYLRIDGDGEDMLLAALLASAAGLCERFTGLALIARDVIETIPATPGWRRLTLAPVRAIASVGLLDAQGVATALAVDAYAIDIDADGDGWVRVPGLSDDRTRASVGYATGLATDWDGLPDALRQGVVRLAAHLHAHRDAPDDGGPPAAVAALWRPLAADAAVTDEFAGRLRERVTILRRGTARDALGGASGAWTAIASAWAAIAPDGSGDAIVGDAPDAPSRWRVTLRAPADVAIGDRVGWDGRTLRVRGRTDDPATPDRVTLMTEELR